MGWETVNNTGLIDQDPVRQDERACWRREQSSQPNWSRASWILAAMALACWAVQEQIIPEGFSKLNLANGLRQHRPFLLDMEAEVLFEAVCANHQRLAD